MSTAAEWNMEHRQQLGKWGEDRAEALLIQRGYQILARNARTPYGELDLVAHRDNLIVFVEVKTRSSTFLGMPETSVTAEKATHILEAAAHYLQEHPELDEDWRVDVIAVLARPGKEPQIEWFEDAVA